MPDTRDVAVRTFLQHMAVEVPPPSTPTPTLLRRARWGIAARLGGLALVFVLVASGVAAGVAYLRASNETPANGSNRVALHVTARVQVNPTPMSVAAGAGSVWVSHPRSISRIDPPSTTVIDTIRVVTAGSSPEIGDGTSLGCIQAGFVCGGGDPGSGDAVGELAFADDAVWATTSDGGGRVVRIDTTNEEIAATIDVPGAYGVAAGEGAVWVAGSARRTGTLVRIDPATSRPADPLFLDADVNALAVGGGSVWVALSGGPVLRIDPVSLELLATYDPGVDGIDNLAFGGGALWGAGDGVVVRLDPTTAEAIETPVSNPVDLEFGGGAMWVSAYDSNEVLALDPSSGAVIGRIAVGDSPNGKAFMEGAMWVALDLDHAVIGLVADSP